MVAAQVKIIEDGKQLLYHIPKGEFLVFGRSSSADVTLNDAAISKKHCKISYESGGVIVEDLQSRNFTFLNGEKVIGSSALKDKDVITIGRVEIHFSLAPEKQQEIPLETIEMQAPQDISVAKQPIDILPIHQQVPDISREENLFLRIAMALPGRGMTQERLNECLRLRQHNQRFTIADILLKKGYLKREDVQLVQSTVHHILQQDEEAKEDDPISSHDTEELRSNQRLFLKIAQTKKLLTSKHIAHCKALQRKYAASDKPMQIFDILEKEGFLDREQIREINQLATGQRIPFHIDAYKLLSLIGVGGMGYIYKAQQISMDRPVAIKILAEEYARTPHRKELFLREARAVAKLNHENIVSGFDFGEINGLSFFIMEYVDGPSLQKILEQRPSGCLDPEKSISVVLQVARALEHAWSKGLIHRDIKPENILLTKDEIVKLCDLGIARTVDQSQVVTHKEFGTPAFMSPEQIRREPDIDIRSDIYSLGVTFYRMLFGRLPFLGNTREMMAKHLVEPVQFAGELDKDRQLLSLIIAKMMAKERKDRYQTPLQIVEALQDSRLSCEQEPERAETAKKTIRLRRKKLRSLRRRRRW